MNVLVNGIGNLGQTLLCLLSEYKTLLNIDTIYALKNTQISSWNLVDIELLEGLGIVVCTNKQDAYINLPSIIDTVDYIFDCNANSFGLKNKDWYSSLTNLKGCSVQGSEKGFGVSYMSGINDKSIENSKFVHVVSCNTHAISSLIQTFSNNNFSFFVEGDFVVVRRSEDLSNNERLVGANVISRHMEAEIGTHHAIDVKDLFSTIQLPLNIQSSDITTPSQLMHTVRFNIKLTNIVPLSEINQLIESNTFVSSTTKFDSNIVFELGRRYSKLGRLYSHAIINSNNLLFDDNRIKGWAFIPQEGNTLISTLNAFLIQTKSKDIENIMTNLKAELIRPNW
jgi:glyceraldehyde-3-phosphate dehydrogenase type II